MSDAAAKARRAIKSMIKEAFNSENFYAVKGKVKSVNTTDGTCVVEPINGDPDIDPVYYKTKKASADGVFVEPLVDGYVYVSFTENNIAFVSLTQDYNKVTIKKGSISIVLDGSNVVVNGGTKTVALAPDVVTQLNALENKVNDLITSYEAHVHPGVTAGGASTGIIAPPPALGALTPTSESDINAPNFKAKD